MSANTLISIDIAARPELVRPTAPRIIPECKRPSLGWRAVTGGVLLNLPRFAWMILDVVLVCVGTAVGERMFVWWQPGPMPLADYNAWITNLVLGLAVVLSGSVFGLYESSTLWARSRIVVRCLLTVTLAMLSAWVVLHLFMYSSLSRRAAAFGMCFFVVTAPLVRWVAHRAVRQVKRGLLVFGQGPLTGAIVRSIRRGALPGYRLTGVVIPEHRRSEGAGLSDIPMIGDPAHVERLCQEHRVAEVVVAEDACRDPVYQRAALRCLRMGCRVTDERTFYETTYGEVPVLHIKPDWFLAADLKGQRDEHAVLKRILDVIFAAIGIVLTAPIQFLMIVLIRLEDGGPAVYTQQRVGQGGRNFTLHKFRTMRLDAEAAGLAWAAEKDPRVTRIGKYLRRLRLDELPQLWNVLRGDMALVGPRPERPEFVAPLSSFIPFYDERHLVKPGLTGWAQINYRYGSSIADARQKLQLDLYYIKNMSLELDLVILLRTVGTFFLGGR